MIRQVVGRGDVRSNLEVERPVRPPPDYGEMQRAQQRMVLSQKYPMDKNEACYDGGSETRCLRGKRELSLPSGWSKVHPGLSGGTWPAYIGERSGA